MNENETNEYLFTCTGGFDIRIDNKVDRDCLYRPVDFILPDGRRVDLFVGLRVTSADGTTETYVHTDEDMANLGFFNQDYDELVFDPSDSDKENPEFKEEWEA